jgi:hypothetical protein
MAEMKRIKKYKESYNYINDQGANFLVYLCV